MIDTPIRFEDGAAYERMMGKWSQLAGVAFLDWLAPPTGACWLDVGCGNGAFTELIVEKYAPASLQGIDPSEAQLAYARTRLESSGAHFRHGDAMALPFPDNTFDIAVMALVIFFVPDPARGVAEMVRVVRPGGSIAAYAWDMVGGGFPLDAMHTEMRALGLTPVLPPSIDASRMDALRDLWSNAGLEGVETREFTVQRTFADFEDLWTTSQMSASMRGTLAAMAPGDIEMLGTRLRNRFPAEAGGGITQRARANAVTGRVAAK
ncbi:MAG TPA: class I SAM-dependent methyltransferase [Vicinamibacterales bacterium]|jgi:ubiquinone/menaquinone biosynthesis C-methylase UbiE